eukprot:COSAG01_NODE_15749_length_1303_cov_6.314784_2_plen_96_part_01
MSFTVKEQREHSLRVFAAEASAWIQLLLAQGSENLQLRQQIAAAQRCPAVIARPADKARQGSTMAGLAQGLGFLRTRRVDLSGESFGDVDPEQALA